jgi:hypothetical protein
MKIRILLIITVIVGLLLGILLSVWMLRFRQQSIEREEKSVRSLMFYSDQPVATFTGALEWKPSQQEKDQINEAAALRAKVPIDEKTFIITFDYNTGKFFVQSKGTKVTMAMLRQWLVANKFSSVPNDQFILEQ